MENKYQKIIKLVNASLNNEVFNETLTSEEYQIIKDNQLVGLVFDSLDSSLIEEELYKKIKLSYYQYISIDEAQRNIIEELKIIFNEEEIDYVFLKGSFLKTIYPNSYMRAMGDIDVLVRSFEMERIHEILEKHKFKNWSNSTNHDCFMKNKVNVEIHPKLDSNIEGEYKDLFIDSWKYTEKKDSHEFVLRNEYNFFYQIYHMIKHLYHSGVGYRTLVDLKIFLERLENSFDEKIFLEVFSKFPNKDFVENLAIIINEVFSSSLLKNYVKNDIVEKDVFENFIEYLFVSGSHGVGEEHNLFIGDIAKKHKKKQWIVFTKIKFLFLKTFLGLDSMRGMYKYLRKYPFLLPIAWIQRFFKLLFKKSSRRKLLRLSVKKSEIIKVEELFNKLGI